jgi:glycosyltransferase involved in cell wall biosynthesis
MQILYHHRTRSTDAQRIHIQEIVRAFQQLGHEVEIASLVPTDVGEDSARDASESAWKRLARGIPGAYDMVQLGSNLVEIPMLLARLSRNRANFLYERYSLFNFAGVFVARLCRLPLILEVNSPSALEQRREREIGFPGIARWAERTICNMATRVIVVSTPLARIMADTGVHPARLVVMPNGVALERFQPQAPDPELRTQLGLAGKRVIGFVGWFRRWHGLELLLQAFHEGNLVQQGAALLLVGDGPATLELKEYVARHGLEQSVVFTGPLPHGQVPRYLNQIDIAAQPAANEYCCPMKVLEYMGLAKPIVAPRQENIEELLHEPQEALLFEPMNASSLSAALKRLVADASQAQRIGEAARAAVIQRRLLWTANAERVLAMVEPNSLGRRT